MDTCLIEFCPRPTIAEQLLCREHKARMLQALHKHLPREPLHLDWLSNTSPGKTWFSDWVRLVEGVYRSRFFPGHPFVLTDREGNFRPLGEGISSEAIFEKTPSIKLGKLQSLAKPHPNPQSQVFKVKR